MSGHYHLEDHERDRYGRSVRVYEDDYGAESSASNREPADRQYSKDTPRQLPTNRSTYARSSTSQHPPTARTRRESEDSARREPDFGNPDLSRTVGLVRSERTYHDDGGYDDRRYDDTRDRPSRSNSYIVPHDDERRIYDSTLDRPSAFHEPKTRDRIHGSGSDPLAGALGKLTLDDVSRDAQYTLSSSERRVSEPLYSQSGGRVEDDRVISSTFHDSKGKSRETEERLSPTQSQVSHHIRGTRGETEKLDKSYIIRRHDYLKFFKPGRIFSTLWTDPYGGTANESENSQFMTRIDYVSYGERVHTKIRRFVVVRQGDRSCTCLPVTTYDGKGYKKRGIKLNEHGLIYSEKHPGEVDGITKKALRVILSRNGEKLRNPSYINYGRLYTVDTNVKVRDVGELDPESRRLLVAYYRDVHFPPDDDYDSLSPTQTPQARADALVGVGSGLAPPQSYSGSQAMMRTSSTTSSTVVPSEYTATNSYHSTSTYGGGPDTRWGPSSTSNPMAPLAPPGRSFDSQAVPMQHTSNRDDRYSTPHHMQRTASSSGYQPPDSRFSQSGFPGPTPVSRSYANQPPVSGQIYSREIQYPDNYQSQQHPFAARTAPAPAGGQYSQGGYQGPYEQPTSSYNSLAPNPPVFGGSQSRNYYPPPANSAPWNSQQLPRYDDDDLELPTLEEARANRIRRDSVSGRHRQGR